MESIETDKPKDPISLAERFVCFFVLMCKKGGLRMHIHLSVLPAEVLSFCKYPVASVQNMKLVCLDHQLDIEQVIIGGEANI